VHYFSDVVGGYAARLLWLSARISGLRGRAPVPTGVARASSPKL